MKSARDSRNYRIITEKVSYLSCLRECSDQGGKPFSFFLVLIAPVMTPHRPGALWQVPAVNYQPAVRSAYIGRKRGEGWPVTLANAGQERN